MQCISDLPCPICQAENIEDLTRHVRKEHNIQGVVCPHCGKILSKTCTLNRHIEQVRRINADTRSINGCGDKRCPPLSSFPRRYRRS